MTYYHVDWIETAMEELLRIYTNADEELRRSITAASNQADKRLKIDPEHEGESRPDGGRIEFFPPLAVTFQVDSANKTVTVLHVRLYGKRKK